MNTELESQTEQLYDQTHQKMKRLDDQNKTKIETLKLSKSVRIRRNIARVLSYAIAIITLVLGQAWLEKLEFTTLGETEITWQAMLSFFSAAILVTQNHFFNVESKIRLIESQKEAILSLLLVRQDFYNNMKLKAIEVGVPIQTNKKYVNDLARMINEYSQTSGEIMAGIDTKKDPGFFQGIRMNFEMQNTYLND